MEKIIYFDDFIKESNTFKYPYRFKTEKEFVEDYGYDWKQEITRINSNDIYSWVDQMDYLLGTELKADFKGIPMTIPNENQGSNVRLYGNWWITSQMLTSNERTTPNYNPKKFNRDL